MLVGGLAVVLHGHLRATGDIDLVVDLAPDQVRRTIAALEQAGFQPYVPVPASDFADPAKRAEWIRDKAMLVFSLRPAEGVPLVDLFLEPPVAFGGLWQRALVVTMRGVPVRVAALNDLIEMKRRDDGRLPLDREALLRTTLALTVDERVAWLEAMIAIAVESGALPKRVPDQLRGGGRPRNTKAPW